MLTEAIERLIGVGRDDKRPFEFHEGIRGVRHLIFPDGTTRTIEPDEPLVNYVALNVEGFLSLCRENLDDLQGVFVGRFATYATLNWSPPAGIKLTYTRTPTHAAAARYVKRATLTLQEFITLERFELPMGDDVRHAYRNLATEASSYRTVDHGASSFGKSVETKVASGGPPPSEVVVTDILYEEAREIYGSIHELFISLWLDDDNVSIQTYLPPTFGFQRELAGRIQGELPGVSVHLAEV